MYAVKITNGQQVSYMANGASYKVGNKTYVPITNTQRYAKRYSTKNMAEKSARKKGDNIIGKIEVVEIED